MTFYKWLRPFRSAVLVFLFFLPEKIINASFLNLNPLFPCTFDFDNSLKALANKCFIVIQQTLMTFSVRSLFLYRPGKNPQFFQKFYNLCDHWLRLFGV
ncbi:MAG: hypothetical protein QNJ63_26940 [Calothrix sp. MO_192.B10]|nr:hypothetical protein [Calothrix sp. MO_192.B10]